MTLKACSPGIRSMVVSNLSPPNIKVILHVEIVTR